MTQGEHWEQWGIACLIAEVIAELTAGEFRAAVWLGCDELGSLAIKDVVAHEWEGDTSEVATATEAGDDHVGIFTCHLHLLLSLQSDDALVESNMV